jgi:hypothetical protein
VDCGLLERAKSGCLACQILLVFGPEAAVREAGLNAQRTLLVIALVEERQADHPFRTPPGAGGVFCVAEGRSLEVMTRAVVSPLRMPAHPEQAIGLQILD